MAPWGYTLAISASVMGAQCFWSMSSIVLDVYHQPPLTANQPPSTNANNYSPEARSLLETPGSPTELTEVTTNHLRAHPSSHMSSRWSNDGHYAQLSQLCPAILTLTLALRSYP
jgi:hypothetical protein